MDECIKKGLLRKVEPSKEKALLSIEEAKNWLREAEISIGSGAFRAGFISIYLAYFHSARAILFNSGFRERSHFCIGIYLQHLVEEGLLEPKWPIVFNSIRNQRHTQQYTFQVERSKKELDKIWIDGKKFIERMERIIKTEY